MEPIIVRKKITSCSELIGIVKNKCQERGIVVQERTQKFKEFLLIESTNHHIEPTAIKGIANYLDITVFSAPLKYRHWVPGFCEKLACIKYRNPSVPKEYIAIPDKSRLGVVRAFHHFPKGYECVEYFNEFVPLIDLVENFALFRNAVEERAVRRGLNSSSIDIRNISYGALFSKHIGGPINQSHSELDLEAIRAIHALLDIHVPYVEGICLKCFQVRFPKSGQGIVYEKKDSNYDSFEIKISPPKPDSPFDQQKQIYITNTLKVNGQRVYVRWEPWNSIEPIFTADSGAPNTHFSWRGHNQKSLNEQILLEKTKDSIQNFIGTKQEIRISVCQCK